MQKLKHSGNQKFYDTSETYFSILKDFDQRYYAEYLSFLHYYIKKDKKVLDIGCGAGNSTYFLSKLGYQACGVDRCGRFIKHAKKKYQNIDFIEADAGALPLDSDSFDVVASYNTVEHFSDVEKSLKEMIRVVKKGGYIAINSPNLLSPKLVINAFWRERGMTFEGRKNRFQLLKMLCRNTRWLLKKKLNSGYQFIYREPIFDYKYPDNDATWYCNPVDLKKFFERNNCRVIVNQSFDHIYKKKNKAIIFLAKLFPDMMGLARIIALKQ